MSIPNDARTAHAEDPQAPAMAAEQLRAQMRELVAYLLLLFGREPRGGLIEVRYRDPENPQGMRQRFHPAAQPARAARQLLALGQLTDVYLGVAPRRRRHGGRAAIERVWALWADVDQPENTRRLQGLPIGPGIAIASGTPGHQHLYWPLTEPLDVHRAEQANRRLAHLLGADDGAVTTAASILRPPHTHSFKRLPPTPVTLHRLDRRGHRSEEILRGVPELPATTPRARERDRGEDPLLQIAPERYVHALTGQDVGRSRKIRCPFHSPDRTPSLHVYPEPERGWTCFGCQRSGSVYDLASELWSIPARGPGFLELRGRLTRLLLLDEHQATDAGIRGSWVSPPAKPSTPAACSGPRVPTHEQPRRTAWIRWPP
jgi:hypothetical protein